MGNDGGPPWVAALGRVRSAARVGLRAAGVDTGEDADLCGCAASFDGDALVVDPGDCPRDGRLATASGCRATVVTALTERDADRISVRADGVERTYERGGRDLLVAAGRFADRVRVHDGWLADRALTDPLAAAREARGRAGPVGDAGEETGLTAVAGGDDHDALFRPSAAPTVMRGRVATSPPPDATLVDRRELDTGATALVYEGAGDLRTYHLDPPALALEGAGTRLLARAHRHLARGGVTGGERAPGRAVRAVADRGDPVEPVARALSKHARGLGVLADPLADERVSDAYLTAPVDRNPLRVVVDGETMRTNVRFTEREAAALASRFRLESGRAFSRAAPTLDATTGDGGVRVAGLTDPASDGVAFAFRDRAADEWTLPALVENGTLSPAAAGLLSVAVRRGAAVLVAGPRGAGKTSTLEALLWELRPETRVVAVEDTPELGVEVLQRHGRDVQRVHAAPDDDGLTPTDAVRTALRLGDGALVVGEVRGEEARALYEAMRVGASAHAVLGTVHGDGAAAVRERVVGDLGVAPSSFAATDLLVTLERTDATAGGRRVAGVTEVFADDDGVGTAALWADSHPTGRVDRGESRALTALADLGETYGDLRTAAADRADELAQRAEAGLTRPADVADVAPE